MNPFIHAKNSARKYGGKPEDFLGIHQFMDSAKAHIPDIRHRLVLHNSFGIQLAEQCCGDIEQAGLGENKKFVRKPYITTSEGNIVYIRDIATDHVREDMAGIVPTMLELWDFITPEQVAERVGVIAPLMRWVKRNMDKIKLMAAKEQEENSDE